MVGSNSLRIEEAHGDRWELALELLESGEAPVVIANVALSRHIGWPRADGLIHISVVTRFDPLTVTPAAAAAEVEEGRRIIDEFCAADARLTELFRRYGIAWQYAYDYGMGSVNVGQIGENGAIRWTKEFDPQRRSR